MRENSPRLQTRPRRPAAGRAPGDRRRSPAQSISRSCGSASLIERSVPREAQIEERQLLNIQVALLRETDGCRGLADECLVGEILARRRHALHVAMAFEVVLDFAGRSRLAGLAQAFEKRREQP